MKPQVSVLMSVYNGGQYLKDAIDSILNQTFVDFEFIIVDDGSTDSTLQVLNDYAKKDSRIRVLCNGQKIGLSASLNKGFENCCGEYIARMDADDISLQQRLEKQIEFMKTHLEVGVCGSWAEVFGEIDKQVWRFPLSHDEICASMLFSNALVHTSVLIRKSVFIKNNLKYDANTRFAQDYELWSRAMFVTQFANLDHVLLRYRVHPRSVSKLHRKNRIQVHEVVYRRILSHLGMEFSNKELQLHLQIGTYHFGKDMLFLQKTANWFEKLLQVNQFVETFSQVTLFTQLGRLWTQICLQSQIPIFPLVMYILATPLPYRGSTGILKIWYTFLLILHRAKSYFISKLRLA